MKTFKTILSSLLLFFWLLLAFGFSLWGLKIGFVLFTLLLLEIYLLYFRKSFKSFSIGIVLSLLLFIVLVPYSLKEYDAKSDEYYSRVLLGEDLTFVEKVNVFNLNIFISAAAYPLYPEIGKESFLMIFPTKNNERNFESDFFMKSEKIQHAIKNNISYIPWKGSDYLNVKEARVALALNPCVITKEIKADKICYSAKIKVQYPENCKTLLVNYPLKFYVQEGLFNYLQKIGWLHTYYAVWTCEEKLER